jgi:hypothetical protein
LRLLDLLTKNARWVKATGFLKYWRVAPFIAVRMSNAVAFKAWLMANGSCFVMVSVHRMAVGSSDLMSKRMVVMGSG